VTIVVPTRNEAGNIGPFLASIDPCVALIVVDASDDATPDLVRAQRPERSTILQRAAGIAEARQIGAQAAQTEWLLFTDADISFGEDYFERLRAIRGDADVIYGTKLSQDEFARYYRCFRWGQGLIDRLGIPAASGSNLLIRRMALDAVGGFDLALTVNEDSEIAWRIKQYGFRVRFCSALEVYERDHRRLRKGVVRKTLHSLLRCLLLYLEWIPERRKGSDWGYWAGMDKAK
jgi:glycosyltransferase involved in cell wall biosynthesis